MIVFPAIDIKDGQCVRLFKGDYSTAHVVAKEAVDTAMKFSNQGARWLHMVDLDGAKDATPKNADLILNVTKSTSMKIQLGGGIRSMETIEYYLESGISRIILGSAALSDPGLVSQALKRYGKRIAIGIDALNGKVVADGWLKRSEVDYIDLAKKMEDMGAAYIIFTDINRDGTMSGPNLTMLDRINRAVSCNIIASGGVSSILDIIGLHDLGLYGVIAGKALYARTLDLRTAVMVAQRVTKKAAKNQTAISDHLDRYFEKSRLIPVIIQEDSTNEVLMLAYMNKESLIKSMETGTTWFYSRSRRTLWNKGETSGHYQKIVKIFADCDDDTLLIRVEQTGAACHTGNHTCFFKDITM